MISRGSSIDNLSSQLVCQYACWKQPEQVIDYLNTYNDVDLLYEGGIIIRLIISHQYADLLQIALNYFEKIQFPNKNSQYFEKSEELTEILEEYCYGLEITEVIRNYLDEDIAKLKDVLSEDDLRDESLQISDAENSEASEETELDLKKRKENITRHPLSNITLENCIQAAKNGVTTVIENGLDVTHPTNTTLIICIAIRSHQLHILDIIIGMAQDDKSKATIYRFIGDVYTTHGNSFSIALEYYKKSLGLHPHCFITFFKIAALYQLWNNSLSSCSIELLNKAIKYVGLSQQHMPGGEFSYYHLRNDLAKMQQQLQSAVNEEKLAPASDIDIEELILYVSDNELDHEHKNPLSSKKEISALQQFSQFKVEKTQEIETKLNNLVADPGITNPQPLK